MNTLSGYRVGAGIAAGVAIALVVPAGAALAVEPDELVESVTVDAVLDHLEALQAVADANGGNRAAGTAGYEASAAYIESVLSAAGYEPERQYFSATLQSIDAYELAIDGLTFDEDPLGIYMEYTPSTPAGGIVDAPLVAPTVATGCDASEWAGSDPTGSIAFVSRGVCSFAQKSAAAAEAGASAAIVYNNEAGPLSGTLGEPTPGTVPTVGLSQEQGETILAAMAAGTVTADLQLQQSLEEIETFNVIAETADGDPDATLMLGAHLDSVPEGPGINDNGSGSAAILEIAVQLAAAGDIENRVRFAWWGAEEIGLLGSWNYVDDLAFNDPVELERIAAYLNFDMVASPNYVISVYDANESTYPAPVGVPDGSAEIEAAFTDYFDEIGQPWVDTAFDGRSDYQAFIEYGIPASGLFTGADDMKSAEEVALFGGTEGIIHDPNYHTAADGLGNVNAEALAIMIGAMAYTTALYAGDVEDPAAMPSPSATPTNAPAAGEAPEVTEEGPGLLAASGGPAVTVLPITVAVIALAVGVLLVVGRRRVS